MMTKKIMKTTAAFGHEIHKVDTIEHEGGLWLVPHWIDYLSEGVTMPNRIIRLDILPHDDFGPGEFVLTSPLPIELLSRESPKQPIPGYEVHELPEIRYPLAKRAH